MIAQLVIVLGIVLAAWIGWSWLRRAHPKLAGNWLSGIGLALLVAIGLWLVATGKVAGLVAIVAGLGPWIGRAIRLNTLLGLLRRRRPAGPDGPAPGAGQAPPAGPDNGLSVEEAREILGVDAGADPGAIKAAYRRLMDANHPDHGGSTWIAARLNQARDRLLG